MQFETNTLADALKPQRLFGKMAGLADDRRQKPESDFRESPEAV